MDNIDKQIHNMARHLAYTRALHNDPEEMTKDLKQAAYLKLLTLKTKKYLCKDLEYAMLEELSRWIYECKRGRGKNRVLQFKISLNDYVMYMGQPYPLEEILT